MSIQELERKIDRKKEEIAETEELIESLKGKLKRAKEKAKNSHWKNGNQYNYASGSATIFASYNGRSSDPKKDVERLERKISQLKDILRDEKYELRRLETDLDFERKRDKKKNNNNGNNGSSGGLFGGLFSGGNSGSGGFFHW